MYCTQMPNGDSREKLAKSVLPDLNAAERQQKGGKRHHPADQDVLEWMKGERKRAEEHAEKRWRAKFNQQTQGQPFGDSPTGSLFRSTSVSGFEMQRADSVTMNMNHSASMGMVSMKSTRTSMTLGSRKGTGGIEEEGGLGKYQVEELQRLRAQADDMKRNKKQLAIEQRIRADLEQTVRDMAVELEHMTARCEEAEGHLVVFKAMRASQRMGDIGRLLDRINEGRPQSRQVADKSIEALLVAPLPPVAEVEIQTDDPNLPSKAASVIQARQRGKMARAKVDGIKEAIAAPSSCASATESELDAQEALHSRVNDQFSPEALGLDLHDFEEQPAESGAPSARSGITMTGSQCLGSVSGIHTRAASQQASVVAGSALDQLWDSVLQDDNDGDQVLAQLGPND